MQDIRRSLMIFHLKEDYSREDLQKAYKKLVKKYHPDFNQENQEWSHKKMTEINLAYEQCKDNLTNGIREPIKSSAESAQVHPEAPPPPRHKEAEIRREQPLSTQFLDRMNETTLRFNKATGRYYEYGLENRYLRYEGNRKFRYRQCIREFREILSYLEELPQHCRNNNDRHIQKLYSNFIRNYYKYIILDEEDIPRHPSINSYWYKMEEYINASLMDYLASFLTDRFGKISWQVSLTQSINHISYLQKRFPRLNKDKSFRTIVDLIESYAAIRGEEEKQRIRFFPS